MSKQTGSVELKLDVIVPEANQGFRIDGAEVQAKVVITRNTALTIMRMVEALINVGGRQMSSHLVTGIVQWPVVELSEALGEDLDEREFTYAASRWARRFSHSISATTKSARLRR